MTAFYRFMSVMVLLCVLFAAGICMGLLQRFVSGLLGAA